MVLFPGGWPAGETVRFERIRTKGAFTVSATATGAGDKADGSAPLPVKLTSPVRIASLAGQNLTVAWWAGAAPTVKVEGGASVAVEPASCGVAATLGRPCYRFATAVGESYTLQGSASSTLKQGGDADLGRSSKSLKSDDVETIQTRALGHIFPPPRAFSVHDDDLLGISASFEFALVESESETVPRPRLTRGLQRHSARVASTGTAAAASNGLLQFATLFVDEPAEDDVPSSSTDYSYTIAVESGRVVLRANSTYGALYAMESFAQLATNGVIPSEFSVSDAPHLKYRGILIDTGRRFWPVAAMKDTIATMSSAKMNVVHWHLSDNGRWAVESMQYPVLTTKTGRDAGVYKQDEVAELIEFAADRGVRMVPEFGRMAMLSRFLSLSTSLTWNVSQTCPAICRRRWSSSRTMARSSCATGRSQGSCSFTGTLRARRLLSFRRCIRR